MSLNLSLPFNPVRHPCRSHGVAINWVYYNVIDRIKPRYFSVVDHDLFALEPLDFSKKLAGAPVYGAPNISSWGWSFWAGYCAFDRSAVAPYHPDFNNDYPRRLDTGGRNYVQIYRHLDRNAARFAEFKTEVLHAPGWDRPRPIVMVEDCIHVGGASYHAPGQEREYRDFVTSLVRHIENGGKLADLRNGRFAQATPISEVA